MPEARAFAEARRAKAILVDEYGYSDPTVYVPQARFWDCQKPSPADSGLWAVVSANMILESDNCPWLLKFPHETLAGGSMYAFHLPEAIPEAGSAGGPPLRSAWHNFAGMPASWPDARLLLMRGTLHPDELPDAMTQVMTLAKEAQKKK